jgi:hypothetical protein
MKKTASNVKKTPTVAVQLMVRSHRRLIKTLFPNQATNIGWGMSSMGISSKVQGFGIITTELKDGKIITTGEAV